MSKTSGVASRRVAYSILFGGYEDLLPQPMLRESEIDAICFTDNRELTSDDWKIVCVEPRFPADIIRSQREIKTRVMEYLSDYDESLYFDNTVLLEVKPELILDEWLKDESVDIALAEHSFRDKLLDEFDEVVRLNYDDAIRVHEQLWDYAKVMPELLESKPLWTGMLARRHTPRLRRAMDSWFEQILRYSRRDQLSVGFALRESGCTLNLLTHDNFQSEWHRWGVSASRKIHHGKRASLPDGPAFADELRARDEARAMRDELAELRVAFDAKEIEVRDTRQALADQEARLHAVLNSTSWKITAPIRVLLGGLRR